MSHHASILTATLAFTLLQACETAVEPKAPYVERLVLYGIATSSSLGDISQTVMLTRTFDVEGLQVPDTSEDRGIPGAMVLLRAAEREVTMQESLFVFRKANGDLTTRLLYTASEIRFGPQQKMSVLALLPDGRSLSAETVSPPFFFFETSYRFSRGITTEVRGQAGDAWTLQWQNLPAHLYWPSLIIRYQHEINDSTRTTGFIQVPMTFAERNGEMEAVYPARTWQPNCSFTFDAIDSAMARISVGDPDKPSYRIISATFSVTAYDPHLARYYTSLHGSADEFSIRSDPAFYTNVTGGIGVLGSQTTSSFEYLLDPLYVATFGYRPSG